MKIIKELEDYKNKLNSYASDSSAVSKSSVSQITKADLLTSMGNLTKENDRIEVVIDNTKVTQLFDTDMATTLKKFSDKVSDVAGISSSIDLNATSATYGQLTINSLIPGKKVNIGNLQINENYINNSNIQDAVVGSGKGAVDSSKAALEKALSKANAQFLDITSSIDLTNQKVKLSEIAQYKYTSFKKDEKLLTYWLSVAWERIKKVNC